MPATSTAAVLGPPALVGAVIVAAGALAVGADGAVGALAGTLLLLAFAGFGRIIERTAARLTPGAVFGLVMLSYLVKLTLLAAVLVAFQDTTLFDTRFFALAVLSCTLVWLAAHLRAFVRARTVYVDPSAQGSR